MRKTVITIVTLLIAVVFLPTEARSQDEEIDFLGHPIGLIDEKHKNLMDRELGPLPNTPCADTDRIAFSATGNGHVSSGGAVALNYNAVTYTDIGSSFIGQTTFKAPCEGIYFFTVSFEKDAYYHNGTADDVFVYIMHRPPGAPNFSSKGRAWSGEGDGNRGTGAYSVVLRLNAGDEVQTRGFSDGGFLRHIIEYNFTGFWTGR